jgi:hypothetical protein
MKPDTFAGFGVGPVGVITPEELAKGRQLVKYRTNQTDQTDQLAKRWTDEGLTAGDRERTRTMWTAGTMKTEIASKLGFLDADADFTQWLRDCGCRRAAGGSGGLRPEGGGAPPGEPPGA